MELLLGLYKEYINKMNNMSKKMIKSCLIMLIMILLISCFGQSKEKAFIAKHELENFSQFKGVNIFKRGGDKNDQILAIDASYFINDISRTECYVITLDKKNYQIKKSKWTTEYYDDADTLKFQQLSQVFMKYEIPRIDVDIEGNVFVYLKDVEALALVRFVNENELLKRSKEMKWIKVKDNWYKPDA